MKTTFCACESIHCAQHGEAPCPSKRDLQAVKTPYGSYTMCGVCAANMREYLADEGYTRAAEAQTVQGGAVPQKTMTLYLITLSSPVAIRPAANVTRQVNAVEAYIYQGTRQDERRLSVHSYYDSDERVMRRCEPVLDVHIKTTNIRSKQEVRNGSQASTR